MNDNTAILNSNRNSISFGVEDGEELVPLKELADNQQYANKHPPPSPRFRSNSLFDVCRDNDHPRIQITEPDAPQVNFTDLNTPNSSMTFPKSFNRSDKNRRLNTQLLEAVKSNNTPEVRRLLDIGANPNAYCQLDYVSACHLAALIGGESLSLLIKAGAEMFMKDILGQTPVHFAAWAGNAKHIAMLLEFPEDLQHQVEQEITPETEEAIKRFCVPINEMTNWRCDSEEVRKNLPKNWADNMDHKCRDTDGSIPFCQPGWSPLHAASAHVRANCVHLLLSAGADPNIRDYNGQTPLDVVGFAFYYKQDINEKHFTETIKILIKAGSSQTCTRNCAADSPLHTAVELGSLDSIQILLDLGAEIVCLNRAGMTPLHVCVKKKLKQHLQLLVSYNYKDLGLNGACVDMRDKDGYTVLHSAVMASWAPGVCVSLEAGANITAMGNDGETPIHSAAAIGDLNILNEILSVARHKDKIDQRNTKEETPLFKAIIHGHLRCVQTILKNGSSILKTLPKNVNVLHVAAELGNYKILKALLDHDYCVTRAMVNFLTTDDRKGFGPLHFAVLNNHPDCVKLLISNNAYISLESSSGPQKSMTPLHMAAAKNYIEIAKIIIKFDEKTIQNVDAMGWSPLHTACYNGSRDVISLILRTGGDLSMRTTGSNKINKTAINMIMNNLSKPTEFLEQIFDSYITSNGRNFQDPSSEITVNYKILMPIHNSKNVKKNKKKSQGNRNINNEMVIVETDLNRKKRENNNKIDKNEQMKVIQAFLETGNRHDQRRLLLHPLIESFLYLKWNALLPFFYTIMGLYGVFVLSLTIFLVSVFFYKDNSIDAPIGLKASYWSYVIYVTVILIISQEVFLMNLSKNHFLQLETWLKLSCIILAFILPSAVTEAPEDDWPRHVATITLLLAWLEMLFLLSRFPKWGYYVLMFGKVSSNVIKILFTFAFLLIGFSVSFMVQFHAKTPFEGPWAALVKTMVMMTSEFNYDDLLKHSNTSHVVIRLTFFVFLILTAIVLMNLMVGVAVNDLTNLEIIGNIRRLEKQVGFLGSLENLVCNKLFRKIMPSRLKISIKNENEAITVIKLKPSEPKSDYYKIFPSHIREAIFVNAQSQKKEMDALNESQTHKVKLDKIYDMVLKCYEHKHTECRDLLSPQTDRVVLKNTVDEDLSDLRNYIATLIQDLRSPIDKLNGKMDLILSRLDKLESKTSR